MRAIHAVTSITAERYRPDLASPPPALRSALDDVATPFTGTVMTATDCTTAGADGFTDLVLHFDNRAVSAALGRVTDRQVLMLTLTGNLFPQFGGTPVRGQDVVVIISK